MGRFILGTCLGAGLTLVSFVALSGHELPQGFELPSLADIQADIEATGFRLDREQVQDFVRSTRNSVREHLPPPEAQEVNVVLNREGAQLHPGPDFARLGLSSVLIERRMTALEIPAYRTSNSRWKALGRCIEGRFDDYQVNILDEAPSSGDYMVLHVGGSSKQLGMSPRIRGLSPTTGRVIPNATMFLFTHGNPSTKELCEAGAHEIGHAVGLDHNRLCTDLMSYRSCGAKSFREAASPCGEYEARECHNGELEQSSALKLRQLVGLRERGPEVS
jgi:hypothetical protein